MLFLFDYISLDTDRRELRTGGTAVSVEPQVFDLLVYLIDNRDHVVSRDDLIAAVWHGRIVSESTLASRISAARDAIGDTGKAQRLIRTVPRKGFRFVGEVREGGAPQKTAPSATLHQEVHFCTTPDKCRIAYATVGEGPTIVKAANWLNHLEYDWESPVWSHFLHAIAGDHRLVRYDARGNGLSDWEVEDISFDAFVRDLESVVEASGIERFALLGMSQGCAVSIAYAVRNPQRVSHLILYGGFARGRRKRGSAAAVDLANALDTLVRTGWGQENPAFRQVFTSQFMPGGSPEQINWFNELQRRTTSPENAARIRAAVDNIDVSDILAQVKVPTLVLHCRDDAMQPFEEGRRMAADIKGAHFVALEGQNHMILESDPSWARFVDEIKSFLRT